MFTGIIQEIGKVKSAKRQGENLRIEVEARALISKMKPGDSVSINGACQTVVAQTQSYFAVDAIAETLSRTNLAELRSGFLVNLELPLGMADLLHGHLVQGHVDCIGRVSEIRTLAGSTIFSISFPREYTSFLIEKGSVAVDGVSLTIADVSESNFQVALIPHTIENTVFHCRKTGEAVNLEFDMVAKYIQKMIAPTRRGVTLEFLKENGF